MSLSKKRQSPRIAAEGQSDPLEHLIRFFTTTIPKIAPDFRARFSQTKDILQHFSDQERLADRDLPPRQRSRIFAEAWKSLVGGDFNDDLLT